MRDDPETILHEAMDTIDSLRPMMTLCASRLVPQGYRQDVVMEAVCHTLEALDRGSLLWVSQDEPVRTRMARAYLMCVMRRVGMRYARMFGQGHVGMLRESLARPESDLDRDELLDELREHLSADERLVARVVAHDMPGAQAMHILGCQSIDEVRVLKQRFKRRVRALLGERSCAGGLP